ncbi:hypothetical protein FGO68_gene1892 [Halteria grandinella]|uniref:Uncharacterized protein n=1 Tax=Halteria grandinella TaxID=5974 RepID=A0A8J8T0L5_HALGN|nr:hypothetical protein FGO68_gene1892 [Halteria grandinella]
MDSVIELQKMNGNDSLLREYEEDEVNENEENLGKHNHFISVTNKPDTRIKPSHKTSIPIARISVPLPTIANYSQKSSGCVIIQQVQRLESQADEDYQEVLQKREMDQTFQTQRQEYSLMLSSAEDFEDEDHSNSSSSKDLPQFLQKQGINNRKSTFSKKQSLPQDAIFNQVTSPASEFSPFEKMNANMSPEHLFKHKRHHQQLRLTMQRANEQIINSDEEDSNQFEIQLMKRSVSHNHRKSFSHIHARYPPLSQPHQQDTQHNTPYLNSPTTANLNQMKTLTQPRKNTDVLAMKRKLRDKKLSRRTEDRQITKGMEEQEQLMRELYLLEMENREIQGNIMGLEGENGGLQDLLNRLLLSQLVV